MSWRRCGRKRALLDAGGEEVFFSPRVRSGARVAPRRSRRIVQNLKNGTTMKLLPLLLAMVLIPMSAASAQTVVDRLRALDEQRAAGELSEEAYREQWRKVLAEGMREVGVEPVRGGSRARAAGAAAVAANPLDRDWEVAFSGSWSRLSAGDSDLTTTAVDLTFGRFVTRSLLIYGTVDFLQADIDGDDLEAWSAGIGADWHFGDRSAGFSPYIGAGVSWANVDIEGVGDDNDFAWDVHAGVRQYVDERVVIRYQGGYQQYSDLDLDGFFVTVGIGLRF